MRLRSFALLLACVWLAAAAAAGAREEDRVVVVGDIHGAYAPLRELLWATGITGADGHWTGGKATLVQLGDILDRGPDERRALDLLMALEREAKAQGGQVVIVLGNHEIMAMFGDWRYAAPEAIADFGGAEARRAALAPGGKYGRWLRKRPAAVAIDGNVFVHGGISREVAKLGLRRIRTRVREEIARIDAARERAIRTRKLRESADLDALLELKLPELAHYSNWLIGHLEGPFWMRGYEQWSDAKLAEELPAIRERLVAARFVVGHSVQLPARVRVRAGGAVLLVDGGMLGSPVYPSGAAQALEIAGGSLTVIDAKGVRTALPAAE